MKQFELEGLISERIRQAKDRQILRKAESVAKQLGKVTKWHDGDSYEPDYPTGWGLTYEGLDIGDARDLYGWEINVKHDGKNVFTAYYHPAQALDDKIYGYIPGEWENTLSWLHENILGLLPKLSPDAYRIDLPNAMKRYPGGYHNIEEIAKENWGIELNGGKHENK